MIQNEIMSAANEMFAKIEAAAHRAMADKHYAAAGTLVTALRRMQLKYGGGVPICQEGSEVLSEAYDKMRELIKEPLASEDWGTIAYASEFLAIIESVFVDEY